MMQSLRPLLQQLDETTGNECDESHEMETDDALPADERGTSLKSSGLMPRANSSHLGHVDPSTDSTGRRSTSTSRNVMSFSQSLYSFKNSKNISSSSRSDMSSSSTLSSTPPPLALLKNVIGDSSDLSMIDQETLQQYLEPIRKALEEVKAESVLDLEKSTSRDGARVRKGLFCKPIHAKIEPPKPSRENAVRYLHVSEVEGKYSIGVFVFPPHTSIPLHDHPGMCVLSRVLYGDLHRTSLDLIPQEESSSSNHNDSSSSWLSSFLKKPQSENNNNNRCALYNGVDYLVAPNVTVLYPYQGNLHEFVAGPRGAAVLDVLLPPYNVDQERDCTFYTIGQQSRRELLSEGQTYTICPTGQPEDFHCLSGRYGNIGLVPDGNDDQD